MSAVATNMIPVILLGIMVALTLIFLPHLNDDTPRQTEEPPAEDGHETKAATLHRYVSEARSDSK